MANQIRYDVDFNVQKKSLQALKYYAFKRKETNKHIEEYNQQLEKHNKVLIQEKTKLSQDIYSLQEMNKTLMCKRTKDPYKGMYNLVGGKIEKITYNMTATLDDIMANKAVRVIFFIVFIYR